MNEEVADEDVGNAIEGEEFKDKVIIYIVCSLILFELRYQKYPAYSF